MVVLYYVSKFFDPSSIKRWSLIHDPPLSGVLPNDLLLINKIWQN